MSPGFLPPGSHGPRTPEQDAELASVEWNARDAHAALACAMELNDWAGVRKYAEQVERFLERRRRLAPGAVTLIARRGGDLSDLRVD